MLISKIGNVDIFRSKIVNKRSFAFLNTMGKFSVILTSSLLPFELFTYDFDNSSSFDVQVLSLLIFFAKEFVFFLVGWYDPIYGVSSLRS